MGIGNGMRGLGLAAIGLLAGCGQSTPTALGTLEWDRITVPAPAAEVIATLEVREGQRVKAGAVLMQLDPARGDAQFAVAQADTARAQAQLEELKLGPRQEQIAQARHNWPRCARSLLKPLPTIGACNHWHASA